MAWYVCDVHPAPVFVQSPFGAPNCTTCAAATQNAHNRVRITHNFPALGGGAVDYELRWNVIGDSVTLKIVLANGPELPIPNDVLAYDAALADLTPATALSAPGGGTWTNNVSNYAGGGVGGQRPAIPAAVRAPTVTLGQNDGGASYGVAHILSGHREMFRTGAGLALSLANFKLNLLSLTAQPAAGTGARRVARQVDNSRYAVHGVITNARRAMIVINPAGRIVTGYTSQQLSGLGQNPVYLRQWM